MHPPIFVISLPGSIQRQQTIAAQLAKQGLEFSWLDGVDGRRLDSRQLEQVYSAERAEREGGRQLNPGEIGCALSHQKIYAMMLERNLELVLVLEDDANLDEDFGTKLATVCAQTPWADIDVLLLSHIQKYTAWKAKAVGEDLQLVRPLVAYNGNGYLVTRRGAEKLLAVLRPIYQPADCWNHLSELKALTIRGVVPYLVNHSTLSENSLIGDSLRENPHDKSAKYSAARLLKRIIYDKFIYQLLVKPLLRIRKQPIRW